MSNNVFPLEINGIKKELKFSFGIGRRIGELSKLDPFSLSIDYGNMAEVYKNTHILLHAALLNNKVNITEEEVHDWMNDISAKQIAEIWKLFAGVFTDAAAKEGEPDTQEGAHVA